jgi:hypothetical protein
MDSSFLTFVNAGLGLYSAFSLIKMLVQFGLPNHPARFSSYVASICATVFFCAQSLLGFGLLSPWFWMKWVALPVMTGGFTLLLQTIMCLGTFSYIQQKVASRLPLLGALICFSFFPTKGFFIFGASVVVGCVFLSVLVGKARYQKRLFFKMTFFLAPVAAAQGVDSYVLHVAGSVLLFFGLFYFFLFEQSFGIAALVNKGDPQ